MSVRDLNIDALAAEAPRHDGPYLYQGKEVFVNDDLPEDFPHLRTMELEALNAIYSNPQYGPRVVAHLLTKPEDIQRHVLLNYVYVQTAELRKNAQREQQAAQSAIGALSLRLNQLRSRFVMSKLKSPPLLKGDNLILQIF